MCVYFFVDQYWNNNGPIFFYTGNEGSITDFWKDSGFVFDAAEQFNALVIFAEHVSFNFHSISDTVYVLSFPGSSLFLSRERIEYQRLYQSRIGLGYGCCGMIPCDDNEKNKKPIISNYWTRLSKIS